MEVEIETDRQMPNERTQWEQKASERATTGNECKNGWPKQDKNSKESNKNGKRATEMCSEMSSDFILVNQSNQVNI